MSLKTRAAWIALVCFLLSAPLGAEEHQFYFKTSPQLEQLRPFGEAATVSLLVTTADGRPVQQGWLAISLDAPAPGRLVSTDFPLVEGTRLAELRLPLRNGKAEWKYLFPIRGEYRMSVDYMTAEGKQASKTFNFRVRENRAKWIMLGGFIGLLFGLGFIAGRIFSSGLARRRRAACLLLWIICSLIFTGGYGAVPLSYPGLKTASAAEPQIGRRRYAGSIEIGPARVGQPVSVRWRLIADENAPKAAVALTLIITHLEKERTVFAVEKISVPDDFSINFHFTDGAEYKISAIADIAGRRSVRTEQTVSVTGVEPPTRAMIPALALFLAVIAAGIAAGRWTMRRKAMSVQSAADGV